MDDDDVHSPKSVSVSYDRHLIVGGSGGKTLVRPDNIIHAGFEERLFDVLVGLKVTAAQYSMHLTSNVRHRIFSELDRLLNAENWYEEDDFPTTEAFRDFLSWTVYSQHQCWQSLGVGNGGQMLAVWLAPRGVVTAGFRGNNKVGWTAKIDVDGVASLSADIGSLKEFDRLLGSYLD